MCCEEFFKFIFRAVIAFCESKKFANDMLNLLSCIIGLVTSGYLLMLHESSFLRNCRIYTEYGNIFSMLPLYVFIILLILILIGMLMGRAGLHRSDDFIKPFRKYTINSLEALVSLKFAVYITLRMEIGESIRNISSSNAGFLCGQGFDDNTCKHYFRIMFFEDTSNFLFLICVLEALLLLYILWMSKLISIMEKEIQNSAQNNAVDDKKNIIDIPKNSLDTID